MHMIADGLAKRHKRSMRSGDILSAVLSAAGGFVLENLSQAATDALMSRIADKVAPKAPRPKPNPPSANHWSVLGLDKSTATTEDVRRVQRELAKIYHGDKRPSGVASVKMAEINAAAEKCLKELKRK